MCGIEGGEWYRIWTDKWVEQSSVATIEGSYSAGTWYKFQCVLLKPYPNTSYYAQSHYEGRDTAVNLGHTEGRGTSYISAVTSLKNAMTTFAFKWIAMGYVS